MGKFNIISILLGFSAFSLVSCNSGSTCDLTDIVKSSTIDAQNNDYETVLFPNGQEWLASNLRTEIFLNGDTIAQVIEKTDWTLDQSGGFSFFENSTTYRETYGMLYNFYAVQSSKEICPEGFHVPDIKEWEDLIDCLGGMNKAGAKLREANTNYWSPVDNFTSTNESTLTFRPGGFRDSKGNFYNQRFQGYFWSSTANGNDAEMVSIAYGSDAVSIFEIDKHAGASVRCMRD